MGKTKIEGLPIWLPENTGDKLEGEVLDLDSTGAYGLQATIKTEKGELTTPAHKWLQNCLRRVKTGERIEIIFTGEEPPKVKGQSPTKKYDVFRLD